MKKLLFIGAMLFFTMQTFAQEWSSTLHKADELRGTKEYVQNGNNAVDEYVHNDDGSKKAIYQFQANTNNTLIKKSLTGNSTYKVDNISIFQK